MIVVLADDLSGAAELAGAAWRHGLGVEVQTAFTPGTGAAVICVATDTRALPPAAAARAVAAVTGAIVAARPAWVFKKCDSVLRGPVLAEARAMARVMGKPHIMILPANPSLGRIIRDGSYYIDGRPLPETAFAHDPGHPRRTASVAALLGDDLAGVILPDAESADDVAWQAAALGDDVLPVGAADFFEALLRQRVPAPAARRPGVPEPAGPTLIVCGSAAAWARRRGEAVAHGVPVFALPHDAVTIAHTLEYYHRALVGIGDGPVTQGPSSAELSRRLARTVAGIFRETRVARVLLEGGATTAAVLQELGWSRLQACGGSDRGVGVLQPAGAGGPRLFVKPGSYVWPPEIWPGAPHRPAG